MPTLDSIRVHHQVQEKLAKVEPPIETPQALLSRDPVGLAQTMGFPLHHILILRSGVADGLIAKEEHCKRALTIKATLQHYPAGTIAENDTENNGETNSGESSENSTKCDPTGFVLGSVTALDLSLFESLRGDHSRTLTTGSHRLDQLLSFPRELFSASIEHPRRKRQRSSTMGGIPFGYVTQVTGPPASGKTQLALMAAANHAANHEGSSVHYLASGVGQGALLPLVRRLIHFCRNTPTVEQVMKGVAFTTVSNGYEVLAFLAEIESSMKQAEGHDEAVPPTLIVFDSASGALSGDLYAAGDGGIGLCLAQQVASTLTRLARQYGAAVLVTNGTVAADGNGVKAAMGQSWKGSDLNLWLTIQDEQCDRTPSKDIAGLSLSLRKIVRATLERHPAKSWHVNNSEERTVDFAITAAGIEDVQGNRDMPVSNNNS